MPDVKNLSDYHVVRDEVTTYNIGQPPSHSYSNTKVGMQAESRGSRHRRKPRNLLPLTPFRTIVETRNPDKMDKIDIYLYSFVPRFYTGSTFGFRSYCSTENRDERFSGELKLNKAYSKMAGSDFNFGETLVELDQSFNMVGNRIRRLYLYFKYARDGNVRGIRDLLKDPDFRLRGRTKKKRLANAYLEYNFGWSPLINDVYNAVFETHKILTVKGTRFSRTSGDSRGAFSSDRTVGRAGGTIRNPNLSTLNQLGLTNPALMAWNRLPFSFLVDWVVPISTILSGLTWSSGLQDSWAYYTTQRSTEQTITRCNYGPPSQRDDYKGTVTRTYEVMSRVIPASRLPSLDYSSHHAQLSFGKLASLTALFVQLSR